MTRRAAARHVKNLIAADRRAEYATGVIEATERNPRLTDAGRAKTLAVFAAMRRHNRRAAARLRGKIVAAMTGGST